MSYDANGSPVDIEIADNGQIVERAEGMPTFSMREQLADIVREGQKLPQVECPVTHRFAPGVYLREIFMPANTRVIGKIHKTEHFNILIQGACLIVHDDGRREILQAPMTFVSKAGVQKVLLILEDMIWQTVHVTPEIDLAKLESELIEPAPIEALEMLS